MIEAFELGVSLGLDTGEAESSLAGLAANLEGFDKALSEVQSRIAGVQLASSGFGNLASTGLRAADYAASPLTQPSDEGPGGVGEGDAAAAEAHGNGAVEAASQRTAIGESPSAPTYMPSDGDSLPMAQFQKTDGYAGDGDVWPAVALPTGAAESGGIAPEAEDEAARVFHAGAGSSDAYQGWRSNIAFVVPDSSRRGEALTEMPPSMSGIWPGAETVDVRDPTGVTEKTDRDSELRSPIFAVSHEPYANALFPATGMAQDVVESGRDRSLITTTNAPDEPRGGEPPSGDMKSEGKPSDFGASWSMGVGDVLQSFLEAFIPAMKSTGGGDTSYGAVQIAPPPVAPPDTGARELSRAGEESETRDNAYRTGDVNQRPAVAEPRSGSDDEGGQGRSIIVHTNVQIDGDVVARAVGERMVAWMNGPLAGTGGFDPRRSYTPVES